jgi:hypothetical protein
MTGINKNENELGVDSIHVAAYLRAKQIPILRIVRSGRFGMFYFPADQAGSEIQIYMAGKALVEPRAYASAIRELRSQVDELGPGKSIGNRNG